MCRPRMTPGLILSQSLMKKASPKLTAAQEAALMRMSQTI